MTPRTLSRSIALALALTLPLTACGGTEETAATPALDAYPPAFRAQLTAPRRQSVSTSIAASAPSATGGSWDGAEFSTCAGAGSVNVAPAVPTLTYSVPLLPGFSEVWAAPRLPLVGLRGCGRGEASVELDYWTDAAPAPRRMPAGAFVAPPGTTLYVAVRVSGAAVLAVGDLGGSLDYVR